MPVLIEFTVHRCIKPVSFGEIIDAQLHYSDASQNRYGTVFYIRMENNGGMISCSFLMAKSRLAPVKPIRIPRLELSTAAVAGQLDRMIQRELDVKISNSFFGQSTAVLRYVKNENKLFQTFAANKRAVINAGSSPNQWFYIDALQSPAEDTSRGLNAMQLFSRAMWSRGPEILWQSVLHWTDDQEDLSSIHEDDPELKKIITTRAVQLKETKGMLDLILSRFSEWNQFKKVVTWLLHYQKCQLMTNNNRERHGILFGHILREESETDRLIFEIEFTFSWTPPCNCAALIAPVKAIQGTQKDHQ